MQHIILPDQFLEPSNIRRSSKGKWKIVNRRPLQKWVQCIPSGKDWNALRRIVSACRGQPKSPIRAPGHISFWRRRHTLKISSPLHIVCPNGRVGEIRTPGGGIATQKKVFHLKFRQTMEKSHWLMHACVVVPVVLQGQGSVSICRISNWTFDINT